MKRLKKKMYKLRYLLLAQKDLIKITTYIAEELHNPQASLNLIDALDSSISHLQKFPYSYKVYQAIRPLKTEYRALPMRNHLVFYTVIEHQVEIHRIIYAKMNMDNIFM